MVRRRMQKVFISRVSNGNGNGRVIVKSRIDHQQHTCIVSGQRLISASASASAQRLLSVLVSVLVSVWPEGDCKNHACIHF